MPQTAKSALVVDDNQVNQEVAAVLLRREGWTVHTADSGAQALQWLAGNTVAVVLLDLSMPGISGEEVCRRLRAAPKSTGLRIVAYTAHALEHERERILACGFDDILVKPVSRLSLLRAVRDPEGAAE